MSSASKPLTTGGVDDSNRQAYAANPGSLPAIGEGYPLGDLVPGLTRVDASGQALCIDDPAIEGFPGTGTGVPFLEADLGDYHNYQLFYVSIRANAAERTRAFWAG